MDLLQHYLLLNSDPIPSGCKNRSRQAIVSCKSIENCGNINILLESIVIALTSTFLFVNCCHDHIILNIYRNKRTLSEKTPNFWYLPSQSTVTFLFIIVGKRPDKTFLTTLIAIGRREVLFYPVDMPNAQSGESLSLKVWNRL